MYYLHTHKIFLNNFPIFLAVKKPVLFLTFSIVMSYNKISSEIYSFTLFIWPIQLHQLMPL